MPSSRRSGKNIDAALDAATPILNVLETALDLAPVPGLGLIPKALSAIVDRVRATRANKESCDAFLAQVAALSVVINGTETKAKDTLASYDRHKSDRKKVAGKIIHSKELQEGVKELLSTIRGLEKSVSELKGGPGFRGFLKSLFYESRNEAVLTDMRDKLANAVQMFQLRGQIAIQESIHNMQKRSTLNSIPRAPAGYRAQAVDQLKGDFTKGTRKGLFEELKLWSDGRFPRREPKRFYFLSGGAGLGKSAIAHQLCTRLDDPEHPHRVGASFFFIRVDEGLSSGRLFFSTLLHQLALSQPTLRPHITATVREYLQQDDEQNIGYASKDLLRKALLEVSASDHQPVFLIVDGVDECRERNLLPELLRSLLGLVREVPWLYVFASSRPEPHVMAVFTAPEARDVAHLRSLDDTLEDLKGDVKLYLEETVPRIPSYAAFLRVNPDALERLSRRADGVFIYARIAVRFLDTYHDHPEEQFELLFSSGRAPWLSPLDALYLQVLQSAFPPADLQQALPARRERLLSLLQIITLQQSSRASRLAVIALLGSGLSEEDVVTMVDRLRSVLLINKAGKVTPLHATLGEFLLDDKRCIDPLYHVDAAKGHACLASACLEALSFNNALQYLANRRSAVGQYVFYALWGWYKHIEKADFNDELENQMRSFVQGDPGAIYHRIRSYGSSYPITDLGFRACDIAHFFKASEDVEEICSEFAKFSAYSVSWYQQAAQHPDMPPEQLHPDLGVVARRLRKVAGVYYRQRDTSVELRRILHHADMERYQAVHAKLAKEICRDEQARKLWFTDLDGNFNDEEGEEGRGEQDEDI